MPLRLFDLRRPLPCEQARVSMGCERGGRERRQGFGWRSKPTLLARDVTKDIYEPDAELLKPKRLFAANSSSSCSAAAMASARCFLLRLVCASTALARSYAFLYTCQRALVRPSRTSPIWRGGGERAGEGEEG